MTRRLGDRGRFIVDAAPAECWKRFSPVEHGDTWIFQALRDKRKSWSTSRYAIFMRRINENGRGILDFARRASILYTNLSPDTGAGRAFAEVGHGDMLSARSLISLYLDRGHDELVHRALKLDVLCERAGEPPRIVWR